MSDNVRRIAAYVPMSRELVLDAGGSPWSWSEMRFGVRDAWFRFETGRSPLTDVRAITMWRPWPQPLRRLRAVLREVGA